MSVFFVLLPLLCFLTAIVQCAFENVTAKKKTIEFKAPVIDVVEPEPVAASYVPPMRATTAPPRRRSTVQIGAVTCEVVEFENFELIRTSENAAHHA